MTGDTIDVGPGTFKASTLNQEGVYLTIQGTESGTAPATTVEPEDSKGSIFGSNRGGWTLSQLTLNGRSGNPVSGGYAGTINLVDSTIKHSNVAVTVVGPTADVHITDSTISGNSVGVDSTDGSSEVDITNSTIADNGVGLEGVLFSMSVAGSIVSGNSDGDCAMTSGTLTDAGYNLDNDGTCGFSVTNHSLSDVTPDLGPLADNGGPTQTSALLPGSPAIDKVAAADCPATDQRGAARTAPCDIGAYDTDGNPTITKVKPPKGKVGKKVTIKGTNLSGAMAVTFNGTSATITTDTPAKITTNVPTGATSGPISLTTSVGGTVTSSKAFKVT